MKGLTIVIPARGASPRLTTCIETLTRQWPPGFMGEVIVVDDGSNDDYADLPQSDEAPVRILRMADPCGPGACRNAGVRASSTEWIAFVDDDCRLPWGWLVKILSLMEIGEPGLVGGRVRARRPNNWWSQAMEDFVLNPKMEDGMWHVVTANCLVHRKAWDEIGGFDTSYRTAGGEDWDFSRRLHEAGIPVDVDPHLWCFHENATTPGPFFGRAIRYGRANAHWRFAQNTRNEHLNVAMIRSPSNKEDTHRKEFFLFRRYRESRHSQAGRIRAFRSTLLFAAFVALFKLASFSEARRLRKSTGH